MASNRRILGWFRRTGCVVFAALCLLMLQTPGALAQVDEGAITGTVVDPSGATVANATVTLLNTDQGITLEGKTNASGSYVFSPVRIGNYSVTATAPGFETTTQKNLVVSVGGQLQVIVTLKTGASSETVTVTSAPPQLQTEESSVGQVMTEKSINDLPLNGRNFTFLAQLGAGVNVAQADTRGNAASGAFTANGLRPAQNNYLLDGIDNNSNAVDFLNGTNFVILPPVDAISEFNVQTADFSAQLGRAAGAVLNATIKTGTNSLHGSVWEFFRNDKLDAADYFEQQKGALRFNQFGASAGGPILKNKIFFFGDYEGFRRVQGNTASGISVPTALERTSNYQNLTDVITGQQKNANLPLTDPGNNPRTDALGRLIPFGTIMDPATTRVVAAGGRDPVTGLLNTSSTTAANVRDPFTNGTCNGTAASPYTLACGLNQIPQGRLDPNAVKLLNLYPNPTNGAFSGNFVSSPKIFEHRNAFDVRGDYNISQKDQFFVRFSYVDDPQFIPGPFGGIADGGAFQQGLQTAKSDQAVVGYTHVFTPNVINVFHAGFNHLHSTRFGPQGTVNGIPAQFGINGIPQGNENGGLPAIVISGLSELGSNDFLPSDEVSQTLQLTDDFTKIFGRQSFKMGVEYQDIHFNTLQPAYSRGEFDFNGNYAGVPGQGGDNTGRAQFLLTPTTSTVGGPDGIGGANNVHASNISKTYDQRSYLALYFQDDFKVNEKLTLNLGLRYDYFSPIAETNGGQANFVQSGPPNGVPTFLIPASGKANRSLSPSFIALAAQDGIAIEFTNKYGKGLTQTQKYNFAPRVGFAYQVSPRFVARGGVGLFFNAFENQGYGPNIGENYPFIYNFNFVGTTDSAPFSSGANPYGGCKSAGVGGSAPIGTGLSCTTFDPTTVNAAGLGLQGLQFNFQTPRTFSSNLSFQYAITHSMSAQVAYVLTDASDLQVGTNNNTVTQLVPANTALTRNTALPDTPTNHNYVPFPDFGQGQSYQRTLGSSVYNGLQTKLEQTLNNGLSFLATYTYSKTLTDANDLLNGGSLQGFRAANVPGLGPRFDWGLASFDIRNVVHLSGGYELPVGKGKLLLPNSSKLVENTLGGWALNFIATLQGGQPLGFACPTGTTSGTNCNDILVPGQSPKLGIHKDTNGLVNWIGNPKAFAQPCQLGFDPTGAVVPLAGTPTGCIPLTGSAALGGGPSTTYGPGFHRLDVSAFKNVKFNERISAQFRAEFFNVLNHPNFNSPNFGGNGVTAISNSGNFNSSAFGEIGSTRDAPFDPRQIQFALKLYY